MKNPIQLLFLIFLISCTAFSQQQSAILGSDDFSNEQERLNLLSNIFVSQIDQGNSSLNNGQNAVIIQQIGNNNRVYAQTQLRSSDLKFLQNGDFNNIEMDVSAPTLNANVIQNGDNNTVLNYVYYSNLDVQLKAVQNGNNLTINRIGVNSLSNKLQLVQEGSFKTITVISN